MYRISRVFETSPVAILKIAGQVTDLDLPGWSDFLKALERATERWMVLDFCDVSRVDRKAAELLVQKLPKHVLLLNCPVGIKNMADSGGLRGQVLEPMTCHPGFANPGACTPVPSEAVQTPPGLAQEVLV